MHSVDYAVERCLSVCLSHAGIVPKPGRPLYEIHSARLSVRLSVCMSVRLSVRMSVRLSVRLSIRMSVRMSVRLSVRPSVCPMPTVNSKTEHRIAFKISVEDTDTRKGVLSLALIHTRVLRSPHWVELMVTPLVVNSSSSSSTCIVFLSYLFCATILLGETNKLILLASSNRK